MKCILWQFSYLQTNFFGTSCSFFKWEEYLNLDYVYAMTYRILHNVFCKLYSTIGYNFCMQYITCLNCVFYLYDDVKLSTFSTDCHFVSWVSGNARKIDFQLKDINVFLFRRWKPYWVCNIIVQSSKVPINAQLGTILVDKYLKCDKYHLIQI